MVDAGGSSSLMTNFAELGKLRWGPTVASGNDERPLGPTEEMSREKRLKNTGVGGRVSRMPLVEDG